MTPAEWYHSRIAFWTSRRDRRQRVADTLSRLRLITFLGGVALLWWSLASLRGNAETGGVVAALAAFAGFAILVVRHARVLEEIAQAGAALDVAREGLARLARDWKALPDVPRPADLDWDAHPYARDLDLYGHASMTKWLGAAATRDGARQLSDWLLGPASIPVVAERQGAIEELAGKREWRESFAVQGRLSTAAPEDFPRFLSWAEDDTNALSAIWQPIVIALTLMTWVLLATWVLGAIRRLPPLAPAPVWLWFAEALTNGWWWLPVVVNVTLSFVLASRVYAVFDRA